VSKAGEPMTRRESAAAVVDGLVIDAANTSAASSCSREIDWVRRR
jgi:hypothetical protein